MSPWLFLGMAIATEVAGTVCMKLSDGFTRPLLSVLIFLFYGTSFYFLTLCLKRIDLGVAYAIWAGVGTALIAGIGIGFFHEDANMIKLISLSAIIAGVVGLNLAGGNAAA